MTTPMIEFAPEREPRSHVRYRVLVFAFTLGALTYLDRVCISRAEGEIRRDLGLTKVQMGFAFSAFTFAYAIFEIPTGYWGDRIGTRRVLTRIVVWWSSFTVLTAAAFSYPSLLAVRFLFGIREAGAWPNVARPFSALVPAKGRGQAAGDVLDGRGPGGRVDAAAGGGYVGPHVLARCIRLVRDGRIRMGRGLVPLVSRRSRQACIGQRRRARVNRIGRAHRDRPL